MAQAAIPTEDPPSDSSLTHHDLRVRASQLDSQIAALRAQLDKLLTDRATVQTGLDAISYPVLTLPFELTSKIFRSTLGPKDPQDPEALQRASLRLGHICRVWRQIALATRELWSSFELTVDELAPPMFDARQTLARTFLSRAAPAPLDITLYGDPDSFPTMLDIVVPYARTWANISLDCAGLEHMKSLQPIHHQLPALTSLKLTLGVVVPEDGTFGNMFSDAPLLRTVYLSNFGAQKSALPWSQLTSLTLSNCSGAHFAQVLGWTPNLVDLFIGTVANLIPHTVALPKLQSVIFGDGFLSLETSILARLDAHLRVLKMRTYDDLAPFSPPMLHPGSLEKFSVHISSADIVAAPSIECLSPMLSLRVLKIVTHNHDPSRTNFSLAPLLVRLANDDSFLPKLESLTLYMLYAPRKGPSEFSSETISNMLCVRFPRGLRHFELHSRRAVPALELRATDLRAKGTRIILETEPGLEITPWQHEF